MSRFLPLTDLLYFRDFQQRRKRKRLHVHIYIYTNTRFPTLKTPGKIEATAEDANAIARASDGKREFGFPNELRLHGPEECVGILIKHQSGTTRMIEIVSSTTGRRGESLRTSVEDPVFPARIRSRSGRTDTPSLPSRRPADPSRLSFADNKLHSVALCHPPADSLRVYLVVSFLHDFFVVGPAMSLLLFNPCDITFSFYVSTKYEFFTAMSTVI